PACALDSFLLSADPPARTARADHFLATLVTQLWRLTAVRLPRQGIGPQLKAHDLGRRAFAALDGERGPIAERRPQARGLPTAVRIVDAAIHPFGVVAHRVGDAQIDPLAVN